MKFLKCMTAVLLAGLCALPVYADGIVKFTFSEDQYLELHYLLQVQGYSLHTNPPELDADNYWSKDFKIRRSRIIIKGQAAKNVEFFMDTDAPNQEGNASRDLLTQDAFIDFTIAKELKIAVGHLLPAFMHHSRQSAASLLCVDYTAAVVPLGGNAWRDTGVEFRGLLAGGMVDYRVGIFDGQDRTATQNEDDMPRAAGRIQINLKDPEEGFFYSGNYLGKKNIISFGFGIDYQPDIYVDGANTKDYSAWTVDAYLDHPVAADNVLTLQAAYVNVRNGQFMTTTPQKASMFFAEGGFLINGVWQPVARFYYRDTESSAGVKFKTSEIAGGLNYFIRGHNANIKIEYAHQLDDDSDDFNNKQVTIQCQILL